jgi:hypothetical protein
MGVIVGMMQSGAVNAGDVLYRAGFIVVLLATVISFVIDPSWRLGGVLMAYAIFFGWGFWRQRRRGSGTP